MAVAVLEHNGFQVIVPKQGCCGLPLQSNGLFPAARSYVRRLAAAALRPTRARATTSSPPPPAAALMLKREAHEILGVDDDEAGRRGRAHPRHLRVPGEACTTAASCAPTSARCHLTVPYHAPCQQRGHGIGKPALEL